MSSRFSLSIVVLLALGASARPAFSASLFQCPDGTPPPCGRVRARPAPAPALSVAILDFQNLSRDTADSYLADGVAEEVAARLGRVQRLTVVSRTAVRRLQNASTMPTADLGKALNVSFLVTGSVRRAGSRVRVGVELLRAATGVQGWADQFDRDQGDLLAIQDEIASRVASGIAGRLLPSETAVLERRPTRNPAAYDAYLQGIAALHSRTNGWADALPHFRRAVERDSAYAEAWAMIGMGYSIRHDLGGPTDTFIVRGREAANRAVALAPDGGLGHAALGFILYRGGYDYSGAEREFRTALIHDPNSKDAYAGLATIYKRQGRFEESAAARQHAMALDPLDPAQAGEMSILMGFWRRYDEAMVWADRGEALAPGDSLQALRLRCYYLVAQGRVEEVARLAAGQPLLSADPCHDAVVVLHNPDTAAIRAAAFGPRPDGNENHFEYFEALSRLAGMAPLARAMRDSLLALWDREPRDTTDASAEGLLSRADEQAYRGDTAAAMRYVQRADAAARTLNDVFRVSNYTGNLLEVLMRLGRTSDVLDRLPALVSAPGYFTRARLRIDPVYAPLRGNPRFEAILADRP